MAALSLLPVLLLAALFGSLSIQLVRSGLRGGSSELWLGCFFGFIGLSAPLRASAAMGVEIGMDPALASALGQGVTAAGMVFLNFFVWKVFREDGDWGRFIFFALAAIITLQMVFFLALGGYARQSHPVNMLAGVSMGLSLGWAFGESLRYWRMMRKRVALGLGDPVIANRFGLWTLWTGALLMFPLFNLFVRVLAFAGGSQAEGTAVGGDFAWAIGVVQVLVLACGPVVMLGTWLIFFPPKRYLERIAARAAQV